MDVIEVRQLERTADGVLPRTRHTLGDDIDALLAYTSNEWIDHDAGCAPIPQTERSASTHRSNVHAWRSRLGAVGQRFARRR